MEEDYRTFVYRSILAKRALMELEDEVGYSIVDTAYWRPREISLFPEAVRREAARMARLYEVFYCLERTVRELVRKGLQAEEDGVRTDLIRQDLAQELKRRKEAEEKSGITPREGDLLDYATLGELSQIIEANWDDVFAVFLPNREAVKRLLANFNALRSPMAHSIPVPMAEATRLGVFLADWFRLSI